MTSLRPSPLMPVPESLIADHAAPVKANKVSAAGSDSGR